MSHEAKEWNLHPKTARYTVPSGCLVSIASTTVIPGLLLSDAPCPYRSRHLSRRTGAVKPRSEVFSHGLGVTSNTLGYIVIGRWGAPSRFQVRGCRMWFPSNKRVTRAIEVLVAEYGALQRRTTVWNRLLQRMVADGVPDEETTRLAAWADRTENFQKEVLDTLIEMGVDLAAGRVDYQQLLPVIEEAKRNGELTKRVLDKLDRDKQGAEARMRAVWKSHGVLDE